MRHKLALQSGSVKRHLERVVKSGNVNVAVVPNSILSLGWRQPKRTLRRAFWPRSVVDRYSYRSVYFLMYEMILVFAILAVTILLFVSDKLRLDLVAVLSLLTLLLTGILTVPEALAGFSASIVMIIACLFIVGTALFNTGVASSVGRWLGATAGTSEVRVIVLLMLIVAVLSAFMSSTGAVAVLLPVAVSLAHDAKTSPTKLLIPLAVGSLIGGMLTLIGTPPNMVVSEELVQQGYAPFAFFAFTPIGLVILVVGVIYMVVMGRHLLPSVPRFRTVDGEGTSSSGGSTVDQLSEQYHISDNMYRLRVRRASPLVGHTLAESDIAHEYHVNVVEYQPWPDEEAPPLPPRLVTPETVFDPHDILLAQGAPEDISRLCRQIDLGVRPREGARQRAAGTELGMAEVLIRGRSQMRGKTLADLRFRSAYGVTVLALNRRGELFTTDVASIPLQFGDTLLVQGTWTAIQGLTAERSDFIVSDVPREMAEQDHTRPKAMTSVIIVLIMLVVMTLQLLPTVTTVMLAAVAMVVTGCLPIRDVYRSINWESLVLIAAMLPMATALEKTGGVTFVADLLTNGLGGYGTIAVMAGLFVITTVFSQFISNTATTVLIAPIAAAAAVTMGVTPHAFLMVTAIAASTAFSTPIASPVNTLVLGPAGYKFSDFAKVGVPLQVVVMILCLILVPLLFPF